jgi:prophage maintenance system killer protein
VQHLRPSDLIRLNRHLTGDPTIGDPDHGMPGVHWKRLEGATDRHQGKVEFYPDSVDERGAVLLDSLISEPPFDRMNTETAVLALYGFYKSNGYELDIDQTDFLDFVQTGRLPGGSASLAVFLGRHRIP